MSVLDFDRDDEGRLFLVMEYVEGRDLASLAETGRLPFSTTIFIISGVLRGLGYAHDLPTANGPRGLVHRDVSPQNVLLSWEGAVKVSDFGIAKAREASAATASTLVKGKPQYMSPEQANGEELDGGSDLFAVGIMAWELLTGGQRLFDGTARETIAQVLFRPIPRPRTVDATIPLDLEAVVMRLLERDRAARYANAEAAIEDLARCAVAPRNGHSELARLLAERFPQSIAERTSRPKLAPDADAKQDPDGRVTVRGRPAGVSEEPPRRAMPARPARRARRRPWIAASAIVAVVAVLVVAIGIRMRDKDVPAASAPNAVRAADEPPGVPMLTVTTDPPGGAIRLDGVDRGPAPMTFPVTRGQRVTVEAMRDGFEPASRVITADRDTLAVTLTLRPIAITAPADAGFAASPPDAPAAERPGSRNPPNQDPKRPVNPPVDRNKPRPGSGFDPNDIISD